MMNTHTRRERETGPTFVGASLKGWGLPLKEVPHAHPDLPKLFFDAAVMPFFFLFLLFFLDFGEGVVAPAAQPVRTHCAGASLSRINGKAGRW